MITPLLRKPHTDAEAESTEDTAEVRMRQALLKLGTTKPDRTEAPRKAVPYQVKPGAGRHRFRQDGEVPVVRISLTEGGRSTERHAHAPVESAGIRHGQAGEERHHSNSDTTRQVQELTEQLRATQTRLGHAELARQEGGREAQARQEEAAGVRQTLDAAETALAQVRMELAASEQVREELERRREAARHPGATTDEQDDAAIHRKVGRPLGSTNRSREQVTASEPEPVKWWADE